jgi:beta-galactosamide-alpha-2,3-sialyltransferase
MDHHKQEPRSLIMCVTPLQMLIAKKLIQKFHDQDFDVLVVALVDNEKYRNYYKNLEKISRNSLYYVPKGGCLGFLDYIKVLKKNGFLINYVNCFLASIDSRHFQYVISKCGKTNVYTFDDGTANIIRNSLYYTHQPPNLFKKIIWRFLGIHLYMDDIKCMSKKHYTLYNNMPNIIENTEYLNLFECSKSKSESTKKINIYLGQPLMEISDKFTEQYILKTLDNIQIDYYFPHPREKIIPKGNFEIISTPLIFEDYLIEYLAENKTVDINLYSYISSALLNVKGLERVNVKYIHDNYLIEKYSSFYSFVENEFDISIVKID